MKSELRIRFSLLALVALQLRSGVRRVYLVNPMVPDRALDLPAAAALIHLLARETR
jgi:hypothetical protein